MSDDFPFTYWDSERQAHVCVFCGDEAREEFYSGSIQSYLTCECEERGHYLFTRDAFHEAGADARRRLALHQEKERLAAAKQTVAAAESNIRTLTLELTKTKSSDASVPTYEELRDNLG